jgi:oxygen-independent coproporphyrinogen-3 oxidase
MLSPMSSIDARGYALYLHIPFCRHRCSYCDFNTYTGLSDLQEAYARALAAEVRQVSSLHADANGIGARPTVRTVFFGGGTPSLMTPDELGLILAAVRETMTLDPTAEVTMEANPGTVDAGYLAAVRALGVNRISFGVQSALPHELALLGRTHDFETAVTALDMARASGFDNVNFDLIYGLPGQTLDDWQRSLDTLLPLAPEHISLYCLTIEPGTPMQRWLGSGQIVAPDPDVAADQYEAACEAMAAAGFEHYEISNWARPGRECRHNLIYWRNEPYLGLGAGAHGLAGGYRYHVVKQPRVYIRRMERGAPGLFPLSAAVAGYHRLEDAEAMSDTAITQLRLLNEGLDLRAFSDRFGRPFEEVYDPTPSQLVEWGLLERRSDHLLLTERGRFLSNQVFYRFV